MNPTLNVYANEILNHVSLVKNPCAEVVLSQHQKCILGDLYLKASEVYGDELVFKTRREPGIWENQTVHQVPGFQEDLYEEIEDLVG